MAIPSIASGITTVVSLYLVFFKDINANFHSDILFDENSYLKDKRGMVTEYLISMLSSCKFLNVIAGSIQSNDIMGTDLF